jgi:hypothetical protein
MFKRTQRGKKSISSNTNSEEVLLLKPNNTAMLHMDMHIKMVYLL